MAAQIHPNSNEHAGIDIQILPQMLEGSTEGGTKWLRTMAKWVRAQLEKAIERADNLTNETIQIFLAVTCQNMVQFPGLPLPERAYRGYGIMAVNAAAFLFLLYGILRRRRGSFTSAVNLVILCGVILAAFGTVLIMSSISSGLPRYGVPFVFFSLLLAAVFS